MAHKQKGDERLLLAAANIALSEGVHAISINHLAAQAGLSKPLIYRYFGGIDGLVKALRVRSGLDDLLNIPTGNFDAQSLIHLARSLAAQPLALAFLAHDLVQMPAVESLYSAHGEGLPHRACQEEARQRLLLGGLCFILLQARARGHWMGVSLEGPNDLVRFEQALMMLMSGERVDGA